MSSPYGNAIAQYYFNDLLSTNIKNYRTDKYDLSLVNVGTASFPTITTVSKGTLPTPSLYQNTSSNVNYSYYTSNALNTNIDSLTGSFSISFWTYVDANTHTDFGTVWCLYNTTSTNLITFAHRYLNSNGQIMLSFGGNYIGALCTANTYNHFVFTCSTSGTTNTIIIYLNGTKLAYNSGVGLGGVSYSVDTITRTGTLFSGTNTNLYVLGGPPAINTAWPANGVNDKSRGFNGWLGQLTIYNKALSESEITYLYTNQSIPPPPPPPPYPCFKEGTRILRLNPESDIESYVPVETLRPGDLIKTSRNGHKAIFHIGKKTLPNPADDPNPRNRLYRLPKSISPGMTADLYITGEHCILYKSISEELKERIRKHMGDVYITEYQYRVPACIDDRAEPYTDENPVTIWHFALENHSIYRNYGVYANGLLVESCSIEHLVNKSNMELID